jgi:thiol-disulfide isomerase/thioredoxin
MRKLFAVAFITAAVTVGASAQSGRRVKNPPPPPPPPPPPQESLTSESSNWPLAATTAGALPEALMTRQLKSIDNSTFRFADFAGKVIVVNVWATWCGPCRREIPDYEKVRKEFAGRDVEFIALTTEDPIAARDRVQKFAREFNFGFRIGWADRDTARILMNGRGAIPQTLVIGGDGTIINHWTGYSPSQSRDRLRGAIEHALTDAKPPKSADTR